jgi:hypothetical protein
VGEGGRKRRVPPQNPQQASSFNNYWIPTVKHKN